MDGWLACRTVVLVVGAALFGCDGLVGEVDERDGELPADVDMYVGAVGKTDMVVGVSHADDKLRIYTCAGPAHLETSRWFKGSVGDGPFELVNGAWSITGAWVEGRLEGTLHTPEGDALPWSADPVAGDTHAGLYAATTGSCTSGVVIQQATPDGPLQAQGTWCDGQGHFAQIIILSPLVATARGIAVAVAGRRGAGQSFYVTPATP
jgi:hypothetical protein